MQNCALREMPIVNLSTFYPNTFGDGNGTKKVHFHDFSVNAQIRLHYTTSWAHSCNYSGQRLGFIGNIGDHRTGIVDEDIHMTKQGQCFLHPLNQTVCFCQVQLNNSGSIPATRTLQHTTNHWVSLKQHILRDLNTHAKCVSCTLALKSRSHALQSTSHAILKYGIQSGNYWNW